MKKEFIKFLKLIFSLLPLLFLTSSVLAAPTPTPTTYHLLAPIGGVNEVQAGDSGSFTQYLQFMINITMGVTAALSVIILIWGGIEYIFASVSESAKKGAKERITNAIFGILIALSAYLLLNTINPDLIKLGLPTLQLPAVSTQTSPTIPTPPKPPASVTPITQPPPDTDKLPPGGTHIF